MTNKNHYSKKIARVSMAKNLGRMVISLDGLLPILSHDTLIMWPCDTRFTYRKRFSMQTLNLSPTYFNLLGKIVKLWWIWITMQTKKCKISAKGQKLCWYFFFPETSLSNDQNHWKQQRSSFICFFNNFAWKSYLSVIPEIWRNFPVRNLSVSA